MILSAGSMMSPASSGSSPSNRSIEPLMSANSEVSILRSPSTASLEATAGRALRQGPGVGELGLASAAAHSLQNLARGLFAAPHLTHRTASGAAHSWQNLASS